MCAKGHPSAELRGCGCSRWDDAAQEMGKTSTKYFALALPTLALLSPDYLTGLVSSVRMCLEALGRNLCFINIIPERQMKAGRQTRCKEG